VKNFNAWLNAAEKVGYLDSALFEDGVYTLSQGKKSLQLMRKGDECLLWSSAVPDSLKKVVGSGVEKMLPRLVVSFFTGVKDASFTDTDNNTTKYKDVGFFPSKVVSGKVEFSDHAGRTWVCQSSNVPEITLKLYKNLMDACADHSLVLLPGLYPRSAVKVFSGADGSGGKTEEESVAIMSSVGELERSIPNLQEYLLFPKVGTVPAYGTAIVSGLVVSSADKQFVGQANRETAQFLNSAKSVQSGASEGSANKKPVKSGFGIFYDTFYPESGPSPDDSSDLIDWVETEEEARAYIEAGGGGGHPHHFHYEPMDRPEKLPSEVLEEAQARDKEMWDKHSAGLISDKELNDYFYGDDGALNSAKGRGSKGSTNKKPIKSGAFYYDDPELAEKFHISPQNRVGFGMVFRDFVEDKISEDQAIERLEKWFGFDRLSANELLYELGGGNHDDDEYDLPGYPFSSTQRIQSGVFKDKLKEFVTHPNIPDLVSSAAIFKLKLNDAGTFNIDMGNLLNGYEVYSSLKGTCDAGQLLAIGKKAGFTYTDIASGVDFTGSAALPELKKFLVASAKFQPVQDPAIKRTVASWVISGKELDGELKKWGLKNPGGVFSAVQVLGVDLDGTSKFKVPVKSSSGFPTGPSDEGFYQEDLHEEVQDVAEFLYSLDADVYEDPERSEDDLAGTFYGNPYVPDAIRTIKEVSGGRISTNYHVVEKALQLLHDKVAVGMGGAYSSVSRGSTNKKPVKSDIGGIYLPDTTFLFGTNVDKLFGARVYVGEFSPRSKEPDVEYPGTIYGVQRHGKTVVGILQEGDMIMIKLDNGYDCPLQVGDGGFRFKMGSGDDFRHFVYDPRYQKDSVTEEEASNHNQEIDPDFAQVGGMYSSASKGSQGKGSANKKPVESSGGVSRLGFKRPVASGNGQVRSGDEKEFFTSLSEMLAAGTISPEQATMLIMKYKEGGGIPAGGFSSTSIDSVVSRNTIRSMEDRSMMDSGGKKSPPRGLVRSSSEAMINKKLENYGADGSDVYDLVDVMVPAIRGYLPELASADEGRLRDFIQEVIDDATSQPIISSEKKRPFEMPDGVFVKHAKKFLGLFPEVSNSPENRDVIEEFIRDIWHEAQHYKWFRSTPMGDWPKKEPAE
jgi:hypothetical protein